MAADTAAAAGETADVMQRWRTAWMGRRDAEFIEFSDAILSRDHANAWVRRAYARWLAETGEAERALKHWRVLNSAGAPDPEAAYHLAAAEYAAGRSAGEAVASAVRGSNERLEARLRRMLVAPVAEGKHRDFRHLAISGVSFCGSTLLDRILGGLPGAHTISESHWLDQFHTGAGYAPLDLCAPPPRIMPLCNRCGRRCDFLTLPWREELRANRSGWYTKIANRLDTGILVSADKTPSILMDRDPLIRCDLVVLFKSPAQAWWSQLRKLSRGRSPAYYEEELTRYLEIWTRNYRNLAEDFAPRGQKIFVYFDALTNSPRAYLGALTGQLEIPFRPVALRRTRNCHSIGGNFRTRRTLGRDGQRIDIRPLVPPDLPREHHALLDAHTPSRTIFEAMRARQVFKS